MSFFTLGRRHPAKERERFYLLPGMGGRAYRRKCRFILWCSVAAGLVASAIVALILCLLSRG